MGSFSPKIFQTGAMALENGKVGVNQSTGFGTPNSVKSLAGNTAFPWLSFGNKLGIDKEEDNSITTNAFKTTARMIGQKVDNPVSFYDRFYGLNRFKYWMFGFEDEVKKVVAYKGVESAPFTPGAAFTDQDSIPFTFLRKEVEKGVTIYVFATASVAVLDATGTLTATVGGATLAYTSQSGYMYEHVFELDGFGRHFRDYQTVEHLSGYTAGDKKNMAATLGKRMGDYDILYPNSMCKGFTYKLSAAGLAQYECNYIGFKEVRQTPSLASTWVLPTELSDNKGVPAHYQTSFYIGTTQATMVELGMSEINVAVETPLQVLQDTISGLWIAEPVLEAKYGLKMTGSISRHSQPTYQDIRDAQTDVCARIAQVSGWYMQEFLIREATIVDAGPDDDAVSKEPLELSIGYNGANENPFATWLQGNTLVHNSPIVLRVRDFDPTNSMFAN